MKATPYEFELVFEDGPARGQRVIMVVEPTKLRWYCKRGTYTWWSIYPPEQQHGTEIWEYKIGGYVPRREGAKITYKLVEEEQG